MTSGHSSGRLNAPDPDSPAGDVVELEADLEEAKLELQRLRKELRRQSAERRRFQLRAQELGNALHEKEDQFLDMLSQLQEREEVAVRRAEELGRQTRKAEAARAAAEAAQRRSRHLLVEAGRMLSSSLDYQATLKSVARFAAPELADWCVIDIIEESGAIQRVAVVSSQDEHESLAHELEQDCPVEPGRPFGVHTLLDTTESRILDQVDEALLRALACDDAQHTKWAGLGLTSAMVVPLLARGHTVGAAAFLSADPERSFQPDDQVLARELATRAAVAVDNARLYEAALAGSRAKSEFLAVISHELRTPLNAIMGYTDLLASEVSGPLKKEQVNQLGRVKASADHLLELIDQILTFSRLEAGKAEVQLEPLDLRTLVGEVVSLLQPLAETAGLDLEVRGTDEPIRVETDPGKVKQILLNLLSNAVKFTREGEVEVTVVQDPSTIEVRVRDTGIGIEDRDIEAIFEPFWQVESSRTRQSEGSGLGLSVSQKLAHLLSGRITVESRPGEGSTFTLHLPRAAPREGPR